MHRRFSRFNVAMVAAMTVIALAIPATAGATGDHPSPTDSEFVTRVGGKLVLDGERFRFAGTNNYYLMYKSEFMTDSVLETAADAGFAVVRTWGSLVIGNEDWSNSVHTNPEGIYFHYWDVDAGAPAFNDGADGLEKLDYVVAKAGAEGLKLVIPLTNNWRDFGGMDQMVRWLETSMGDTDRVFYHSDFYTDELITQWYKDWIEHLLERTNVYTGIKYKDDPTIMTWELGNEPRCKGSGLYPASPECTTETLTAWADEMSRFIKSIDSNHLVSVGDEGFYCDPDATDETHWTENCGEGVDTIALTKLPAIDVMSFHAYPDHWGTSAEWTTEWIERHLKDARKLRKPAMLGEFGWADAATRNPVFKEWTDTVVKYKGAGALYWILSGEQDDGSLYPDYDGFTVYCPTPVCTTLSNFADIIEGERWYHPPVADHDRAVTEFGIPVAYTPAANDIAYGKRNRVLVRTIDLDPATPGRQWHVTVPGGMFDYVGSGEVVFTPDAGFAGDAEITYQIMDRRRVKSNEATISVTVKPEPGVPLQLFSFETGTDGWDQASFETTAGAVAQTDAVASDGAYSLEIIPADGGWFGVEFSPALDLSAGYSVVELDRLVDDAVNGGTWHSIAIQTGDAWDWCEGAGEWLANTGGVFVTTELDLLSLSCASPDLGQVHTLLIYGNGYSSIDNVWVK